jgi:hypothetical protein
VYKQVEAIGLLSSRTMSGLFTDFAIDTSRKCLCCWESRLRTRDNTRTALWEQMFVAVACSIRLRVPAPTDGPDGFSNW